MIWLASTVTIVVLLFGYHTSTNKTVASTTPVTAPSTRSATEPGSGSSSGSGSAGGSGGSGSSGTSGSGSSGSNSSASKTVAGSVAETRWGPVQVQLTVKKGTITAVDVLQYPNGNGRDAEINDYALPILVDETIKAQSAQIDMVSGATVTSDGYITSLQSALDKAGL